MKFIDKLVSKLGFYREKQSSYPGILSSMVRNYGASPRPNQQNISNYLGRYADQTWVFSCISLIHAKAASVPLKVYRKENDELIELPNHPLKILLDKVNPWMSGYDLQENTYGYLELTGNSYWLLDMMVDGKPTEIYPLSPMNIRIKIDRQNFIFGYEYVINGRVLKTFSFDEILHFKYWNPLNEFYGLSPLSASRDAADSLMFSDRYNRNFFENNAEQGGILSADSNIDEVQKQRISSSWKKLHQGVRKAFDIAILDGGLKWQSLSTSNRDMQFTELKKMSREDVLSVFRIPPVMVGVFDQANYANSREQRRIFWMDSMIPRLLKVQNIMNEFLIRPYEEDLRVFYDISNIEDLQDDKTSRATEDEILSRSGIMTINEIRTRRNLDPVDWGDVWNAPFGLMPIDSSRQTISQENINEEDEEEKSISYLTQKVETIQSVIKEITDKKETINPINERKEPRVEGSPASSEPDDTEKKRRNIVWGLFKSSTESMERRWTTKIKNLFNEQEDEVIDNIRNSDWKKTINQFVLDDKKLSSSTKQDIELTLFDMVKARSIFRREGRRLMSSTLKSKADEEVKRYDLQAFSLENPRVNEWLDQKAFKFANEVNQLTQEALRGQLKEAISLGESIPDVEKRIEKVFDLARGFRTERIARTEVISSSNRGAMSAYEESGVIQQTQWLTARVPPVRLNHQIDGETRNLGEKFSNGLTFPGDPAGDAENIINCRCTVTPVIKKERGG